MEKPYGIIYLITCLVTLEKYVGQTVKKMLWRWNNHVWLALSNKHDNIYLHNAIRKYGVENFKIEQLLECETMEILNIMETFEIIVYHSHWTEDGYNLTWGGEGSSGRICSEETRQKIAAKNKGRVFTKEQRENMGQSRLGKKRGSYREGTGKKISDANKGKILSEEHKRKLSIAGMGRIITKVHRDRISKALRGVEKSKEAVQNSVNAKKLNKARRLLENSNGYISNRG